jgi:Macrocin-O-methyltransferase (TylF)
MARDSNMIDHVKYYSAPQEVEAYTLLHSLFVSTPIPPKEQLANLGLYLTRPTLARIIFLVRLYERILNSHGVIMEFGARWGHNLALFATLRNIFEPQNISRRIIGFDTFEGFASVSNADASNGEDLVGRCSVTPGYEEYLEQILDAHEALAPRSHIRKFELIKGDVVDTLPQYLAKRPETIVALAYFDLDLYQPTKACLELIKDRVAKGSIIAFDQLGMEEFPGETLAALESLNLRDFKIVRDPIVPYQSYLVVD